MSRVRYRTQAVGPVDVFYREAGPADVPVLLLLHGFPNCKPHVPRLDPLLLADEYRLIAPDPPGFA